MMVEQGLFTEVAGLLEAGLSPDAQSLTGIGYREIVAYHKGLLSKEEAIEAIKKHTRHLPSDRLLGISVCLILPGCLLMKI